MKIKSKLSDIECMQEQARMWVYTFLNVSITSKTPLHCIHLLKRLVVTYIEVMWVSVAITSLISKAKIFSLAFNQYVHTVHTRNKYLLRKPKTRQERISPTTAPMNTEKKRFRLLLFKKQMLSDC